MSIKVFTVTEEKKVIPIFGKKKIVLSFFDVDVDDKEYYRIIMDGKQVTYMRGRDKESQALFAEVKIGNKLSQPIAATDESLWLGRVACDGSGKHMNTPHGRGFMIQGPHSALLCWDCNSALSGISPVFSVVNQGGESANFVIINEQIECVQKNQFLQSKTREWMENNGLGCDYSGEIKINDRVVYFGRQKSARELEVLATIGALKRASETTWKGALKNVDIGTLRKMREVFDNYRNKA